MKVKLINQLYVLVILSTTMATSSLAGEQTRLSNPNAFGVELLGRGLVYSVFYDRVMSDVTAAGFGIGSVSTSQGNSTFVIPAYFNYYLAKNESSVFLTGGASIITNTAQVGGDTTTVGSLKFPSTFVVPQAGVGFEDRSDAGFLFRVTGYAMLGSSVTFWAGFSFGYTL